MQDGGKMSSRLTISTGILSGTPIIFSMNYASACMCDQIKDIHVKCIDNCFQTRV